MLKSPHMYILTQAEGWGIYLVIKSKGPSKTSAIGNLDPITAGRDPPNGKDIACLFNLLKGIASSFFKQEGIAVGRTFAALKDYQVDGNKEMIAIGFMNMVGSSTSCYVTTGAKITSS